MSIRRLCGLTRQAFQLTLAAFALLFICTPAMSKPMVVAYLPNWIDLNAIGPTIDYASITHLNLAFENPVNAAGDMSFERAYDAVIKKAHTFKIKTLVSIGGGSVSENKVQRDRYFDLISDAKRSAFVAKLAQYVTDHQLDGVDVDLEGPAINRDYGAFIRDLGAALKRAGKLISAAVSQGYGGDQIPNAALDQLDYVNIMAYDAVGAWNPNMPGQHSSLEYARSNVTYWLNRGLSKRKAVLGVPFYGYGFGKAYRNHDYGYSEILGAYPGAEKVDQVGDTIWYNGIGTIRAKAQYVLDQELAGVMIWSLDYDVRGDKSLLTAIHDSLTLSSAKPRSP